jgi:His/Glu/Gln/Arg/opine family amino acid ABC transporter permease subunit
MERYQFDFTVAWSTLPNMIQGLGVSILLAAMIMMFSLPLGLLLTMLRLTPFKPVNALVYLYVEIMRTTPLLVIVIWFYFVPRITYQIALPAFTTAVIAYTLNLSAFVSEVFRGSIQSINPAQREAALATGMTHRLAMQRIILPQALLRSVPVVASYWISLFKDTSLVAIIGVQDLMYVARAQGVITYRPLEIFTVAALLYFILTYPQSILVNRLFERFRVIE